MWSVFESKRSCMVTLTVRKIIIESRNAAVCGIHRLTNEYQESSLGSKSGWYVGLTTLLPSCASCLEMLAGWASWSPKGLCPGWGHLGSSVRTLQSLVLSVRTASFHTKMHAICLHTARGIFLECWPWTWRHYDLLKLLDLLAQRHSMTSQKNRIAISSFILVFVGLNSFDQRFRDKESNIWCSRYLSCLLAELLCKLAGSRLGSNLVPYSASNINLEFPAHKFGLCKYYHKFVLKEWLGNRS